MREIKLENGGGRRTVIMKKTDKFIDVLRKLREKYFPSKRTSVFFNQLRLENYNFPPKETSLLVLGAAVITYSQY